LGVGSIIAGLGDGVTREGNSSRDSRGSDQSIERWGKNHSVALQIQALIGSLDDTPSDEVILSELRAMNAVNGLPFVEVFASVK
jgi:hypothetical protein